MSKAPSDLGRLKPKRPLGSVGGMFARSAPAPVGAEMPSAGSVPATPLVKSELSAKPRPTNSEAAKSTKSEAVKPAVSGELRRQVKAALFGPPGETAPVVPAISQAERLYDEVARLDPIPAFGRLNSFLDEACAALFGADRWCAYLETTGSATVRDLGSTRTYDFAPAVPTARFDAKAATLVIHHPVREPPRLRALLAAHLARQDFAMAVARREELRFEGALSDPGSTLWLRRGAVAETGRVGEAMGSGPGLQIDLFAWRLGASGPLDDRPADNALRLVLAALAAGEGSEPLPGAHVYAGIHQGGGAADFAEAMLTRTAQALHALRDGATFFDAAVAELPYYGIVEGRALRFMSFAGAMMAETALLAEARLSGRGVLTALPGGPGAKPSDFAPTPGPGRSFDSAWFEAAYAAVRGFFPVTPSHDDDCHRHPYRPADLAEGLEHARDFAFAHMAVEAWKAGTAPDRADPAATAEFAFWRDAIIDEGGRISAHGFAPLLLSDVSQATAILAEPEAIVPKIRARKRAAGILNPLGDVAAPLREKVTGIDLATWVIPTSEAGLTTTRHQRRVAASRRELAGIMAAREAEGLEPMPPRPEPFQPRAGWPKLKSPRQDEILQLIPLDQCLPRLKDHPAPLAAYQLEEPWFVVEARARKAAANAGTEATVGPEPHGPAAAQK